MEPQPGEVWVITEPKYGPESWQTIRDEGPFIVTYVTRSTIGVVAGGAGTEPQTYGYRRDEFDWLKHASRLWPPIPSWDELERKPELAADDLRAQHVAGQA